MTVSRKNSHFVNFFKMIFKIKFLIKTESSELFQIKTDILQEVIHITVHKKTIFSIFFLWHLFFAQN